MIVNTNVLPGNRLKITGIKAAAVAVFVDKFVTKAGIKINKAIVIKVISPPKLKLKLKINFWIKVPIT